MAALEHWDSFCLIVGSAAGALIGHSSPPVGEAATLALPACRTEPDAVRVMYQGEVIADTREAVEMHESTGEGKKTVAPVVYYIPRKDVRMERLARSSV